MRVEKLPEGTVKFEDISDERFQGTVDRPLSKSASKRQHDPLHGKIVYTPLNSDDVEEEIVFSERDLHGDFSLRVGDVVEFNIAVGRFSEKIVLGCLSSPTNRFRLELNTFKLYLILKQ